jgi:hypothetical protein
VHSGRERSLRVTGGAVWTLEGLPRGNKVERVLVEDGRLILTGSAEGLGITDD